MRKLRSRRVVTAGLLMLGIAAYGATSISSSLAATPRAKATPAASKVSSASMKFALAYTGAKAGKANSKLSPIRIGFTTNSGGSPSFPENIAASKAFTAFINNHLSGVDGHPVVLDSCYMTTEEDGLKCGSQFVSHKDPVVNEALAVVGNASLYSAVSPKIPVLIGTPSASQDYSDKNAYTYSGGGPAVLYAMAADAKAHLHATSGALISVNNAGGTASMTTYAQPDMKALGLTYKPTVYYQEAPTTPDIVSAIEASGASSASFIYLDPSAPSECLSVYDALKELNLNKPVETTPICNASSFVNAPGVTLSNWRIWGFSQNPRVSGNKQVDAFNQIMAAGGAGSYATVGFSTSVGEDLLTIDKFFNELGPKKISAKTMSAKIKGFAGPAFLVPGAESCAKPPFPASPTTCSRVSVGSVVTNGKWKTLGALTYQG